MPTDRFADLESVFHTRRPIIGMIHLAPLPGSPRHTGMPMRQIADLALREAHTLAEGGVHGAIVENFGDVMFLKRAPPETIAAMTYVATCIAAEGSLPLGICVLQSDAIAALAIAHTVGARFVRVPYYTETYVVDAGLMDSIAGETLRYRKFLGADVRIFADVHIKHGYPLSQRPIEDAAVDAVHRGLADTILVTGKATGAETNPEHVRAVKSVLPDVPVFAASGVDEHNFEQYCRYADGVVLGTRLKVNNETEAPTDPEKVRRFMSRVGEFWK